MTLNHIHKFHPLNSPYLHSLLDNGDNFNNLRLTFDALDTYDTPSLLHAIPLWHMLSQWNPGYSGQLAGISHTRHHVSVIAVTAIGDWGQRRTPTSSTVTNFVWSLSCAKYPLIGHHRVPKHQYTSLKPACNSYPAHGTQVEYNNHRRPWRDNDNEVEVDGNTNIYDGASAWICFMFALFRRLMMIVIYWGAFSLMNQSLIEMIAGADVEGRVPKSLQRMKTKMSISIPY